MRRFATSPSRMTLGVLAALAVLGGTAPAWADASNAAPLAAGLSDSERAAMREQIKRELMVEMKAEMKAQMADEIKRQVLAELTGSAAGNSGGTAATAPATKDAAGVEKTKARVVRVPYVPESMRMEIRNQVKQEVLAQAKEERWGNPGTLPEWLERFQFEGDVRLRYDAFQLGDANSPAGVSYWNGSGANYVTRGADLAGGNVNPVSAVPNTNTNEDFSRTRLRLRFGANAKISDTVSAGFRISTGSTSGPTSTNQTMGQGFNKYSIVLDRGYVTFKPTHWLKLTGGRISNPFFSTDLVWADDLGFEGAAATATYLLSPELEAFATLGWFPLRTDNPLQTNSRDLTGAQAGLLWRLTPATELKLAAALYDFRGVEGRVEDISRYGPPAASDYGVRYEYPNGLRQRGNTLFVTNATGDPLAGTVYWGLASKFRELNLTGSVDFATFDPVHVVLTGDYVKNLAFDRAKMSARAGETIVDGRDSGYLGKVLVGYPVIANPGEWNVSLAYRWLGSDAVLDAFTNSDFGMGGTNNKGYILGGSYGIDKNTWVSARWMSSDQIDSYAPKLSGSSAPTKLSVDLLQLDLNSKF